MWTYKTQRDIRLKVPDLQDSKRYVVTSLAPRRCGSNLKRVIFKLFIQNSSLETHCEIVFMWMPQNLTKEKSTLVQVMAWLHQAIWADLEMMLTQIYGTSQGHKELTPMNLQDLEWYGVQCVTW